MFIMKIIVVDTVFVVVTVFGKKYRNIIAADELSDRVPSVNETKIQKE